MRTAGSPAEPRRTSSTERRAKRLATFIGAFFITLGLWVGAPTSASAISGASCSGLDASCLTHSIRDDAAEITRAAGDGVRNVGDQVDDAVAATADTIERIVGASGSSDVPTPGGGIGGGRGGADGGGGGQPKAPDNGHETGPSSGSRTHVGSAPRAVVVPNVLQSTPAGPSTGPEGALDPSIRSGANPGLGVGRIAADIGHRVALPLALLLVLAVAFAAMQSRLDRTDPKLHLSPLDEEVSRFR